ncbi:IclR family transcriptional regulator C-terminal domain-containing protein [Kocuria sp. CPCC 205292]|uniref:IclR family transcriptional regulator domain-containing protein n=1 Tax=Kocuria cellulosilytica TaxID=3071451 RepID=UPI0034D61177
MSGRSETAGFVEALARGLDVIQAFGSDRPRMSLTEVASATGLARPTAHRLLLTLKELGFVRQVDREFQLTVRVVDLGMSYVDSLGLWDIARPHLEALVGRTGESSSMAQLDGADIVYTARVSVPRIIALRVELGTRFPAAVTSQGKVLLAGLGAAQVHAALDTPSRSSVRIPPVDRARLLEELALVRERGWAVADEELAPGVRSIAAPVTDESGRVESTVNITVHAAETPLETLTGEYLPHLLRTADAISADWAAWRRRPRRDG